MILVFIMTSGVAYACGQAFFFFLSFFFLAIFLQIFPLFLFVSLFLFYFVLHIYLIFSFWPGLLTLTSRDLDKRQGQSRFQNSFFFRVFFSAFEGFWCPPSMCFRTNTTSIQVHGTGTYKEININIIRE